MGDLVEMVVFNGGLVFEAHPFHLHGHYFAVLGIEKVNQNFIRGNLRPS